MAPYNRVQYPGLVEPLAGQSDPPPRSWAGYQPERLVLGLPRVLMSGSAIQPMPRPSLYQDLVDFLPLSEASGTRVGVRGYTLTAVNNPLSAPGLGGATAAQFVAASSQRLTHDYNGGAGGTDPMNADTDFTMTAWVNLTSATANMIIGGSQINGFRFGYDQPSNRFTWNSGSSATTAGTFGAPSISTWYFLCGTWDSASGKRGVSVNAGGVDLSAVVTPRDPGVQSTFRLGCSGTNTAFYDGLLMNVGVWNRVLSAAEITLLYAGGLGRSYPF